MQPKTWSAPWITQVINSKKQIPDCCSINNIFLRCLSAQQHVAHQFSLMTFNTALAFPSDWSKAFNLTIWYSIYSHSLHVNKSSCSITFFLYLVLRLSVGWLYGTVIFWWCFFGSGDDDEQQEQLIESVGLEEERESLKCFRCDLGFWDACYTTETHCSFGERCFTGRGKAGVMNN